MLKTWVSGSLLSAFLPTHHHILLNAAHFTDKITSKCYDRYGCYSIIGPWKNDLTRPVSLYPDPPESIKPQYCLYTRRSPRTCDQLLLDDPSSIYRSSYVTKGQVYFIAHGFLESGNRPWITVSNPNLFLVSVHLWTVLKICCKYGNHNYNKKKENKAEQ